MISIEVPDKRIVLRHVHRGVFSVVPSEPAPAAGPREAARRVREALGVVQGETSPVDIEVHRDELAARIWREPGVSGFRLTLSGAGMQFTEGVPTFDEALLLILGTVPPPPEDLPKEPPDFVLDPRFSYAAFAADAEPAARAAALAQLLASHLDASALPGPALSQAIDVLRAAGHDLSCEEGDDEASIWAWSDFARPGAGLRVSASHPHFERSSVSVEFRRKGPGPVAR